MKINTKCIQSGYTPKNGEPRVLPINMSTTYKYDSTKEVGDLFDLKTTGYFYTRLANPTSAAVEEKITALEGGVGAIMTASGMSATMLAILNIAGSGDHIISSSYIYGGTLNLFAVTFKKLGIEVTFIDVNDTDALEKAIKPNTKAVFAETIANPALVVLDIETVAKVCHKHGLPLMVDSTFATPILCRPFEFGADIIVHSTSKYLDGHATSLGGMIVDSGNFDWRNPRFPEFNVPDESYHGIVYTEAFGKSAFTVKARVQMMRDLGASPSAMNAFCLNLGMETLHLRMPAHCNNALRIAEFLKKSKQVKSIKYPFLTGDSEFDRAKKYLTGGSGVITFELESYDKCVKFMDSLKLACIVVHVADARTGVLHPASSTHRQLNRQQMIKAGITPETIRFSVGIEDAEDIIDDIKQALAQI